MSPIYTAPDQPPINWHAVSPAHTALVLLDWREGPGTTIAKRDAAGSLYGCRDVTEGPKHDEIVIACCEDAKRQGLKIEDRRRGIPAPVWGLFGNLPEQRPPSHRACTLEPERSKTEAWDAQRGKWVTQECWRHPDFPGWIADTAEEARALIKRMRESRCT